MPAVAIELKTACAACGQNLPINALIERVACGSCATITELGPALWRTWLETPLLEGARAEPERDYTETFAGARPVLRTYARRDATCPRCELALSIDAALAHAGSFACSCGEPVVVRAVPTSIAGLGGVTHVIAEDRAQIDGGATAANEPEVVRCPACGGSVAVSGEHRAVACNYCAAEVVVPDAVWTRVHPLSAQRTFFLWIPESPTAGQGRGEMDTRWGSLDDVVCDAHGNLYLFGIHAVGPDRKEGAAVWSTDAQLRLRWARSVPVRSDLQYKVKLAVGADRLLVWRHGLHEASVLACSDGSSLPTLGGQEPAGATEHHFDLAGAGALAFDVDGSILALVHNRLLRYTPDGKALETWPPKKGLFGARHQKLQPLFDAKREPIMPRAVDVSALRDRPTDLDSDNSTELCVATGALHVAQDGDVAKLDREGKLVWRAKIEAGSTHGHPCADATGNIYLLRGIAPFTHGVFRISPDGRDVKRIIDGGQPGTPLGEDRHLVVLPDGALMTFASVQIVRIFAPDGTLRFASPNARETDAKLAERRATGR